MKESAATDNAFDEVLLTLYDRLNLLYFLIHFLDSRMTKDIEDVEKQIENAKASNWKGPFHGTALIITDLTGETENGWMLHGHTGRRSVEGLEFIDLLSWIASREGALAVVQGYEAFERFLYDIAASFGSNGNREEQQTHFGVQLESAEAAILQRWQSAIRRKYRRLPNHKLINKLRKVGEGLAVAEDRTKNTRRLNMIAWYKIVGEVRYAVTHNQHVIKQDRLQQFSPEERAILEADFPGEAVSEGYLIQMEKQMSKFAIQLFAEYGHAIYKSLSIATGRTWINHLE